MFPVISQLSMDGFLKFQHIFVMPWAAENDRISFPHWSWPLAWGQKRHMPKTGDIISLIPSIQQAFPDPRLLIFWKKQRHIWSFLGITRTEMTEQVKKMGKIDLVGTLIVYYLHHLRSTTRDAKLGQFWDSIP